MVGRRGTEWAVVTHEPQTLNQLLIEMDGFDGNENITSLLQPTVVMFLTQPSYAQDVLTKKFLGRSPRCKVELSWKFMLKIKPLADVWP